MGSQILDHVSKCEVCEKIQCESQKEPMLIRDIPTRPWQYVACDIFEYKQQSFLVTVDFFSNFFEIDRLESKKAKDVIYPLKKHLASYGLIDRLFSDNGQPFSSSEFRDFAKKYEFEHITSSPTFSQSNGKVENSVKTAKRLMAKAAESGSDVYLSLLDFRNTRNEKLGLSPAEILFGRKTKTLMPIKNTLLETPASRDIKLRLAESKQKQAFYYDRGSKIRSQLSVGTTVRARLHDDKEWEKAEIINVHPFRSYALRNESGRNSP